VQGQHFGTHSMGEASRMKLHFLILCGLVHAVTGQDLFLSTLPELTSRPNIVWFLTDDQDQVLGGSFPPSSEATPMPKTKRLMQDQGAHATNFYIHTPICSPSRSELLTGRYFHNIKKVGLSYMHVDYQKVYDHTFVKVLQEKAGYATGLFGKFVNTMPKNPPLGFDAWLANPGGDYIAPSFQTKNIDGLPDGEVKFTNHASNYSTSVIGNISLAWIKKVAKQGKPFFAYIAPKAAHEPFNPAVWYRDYWHPSWPKHEPHSPNWNCSFESRTNHHGNIPTEPMITGEASKVITGVFRNRWRTLMSVDDLIADVIEAVDELGLSRNTYFFYSSDHGFQLGQFNIPFDKRHVYEWDTKIHLLARGPGITAGSSFSCPATQVDIAPTLLGLAGLPATADMDGKSIVPFLIGTGTFQGELLESTRTHLKELGDMQSYSSNWRKEVFIEYYYCDNNIKCTHQCPWSQKHYPEVDSNCADLAKNSDCWCPISLAPNTTCYATESRSNNFIALRRLGDGVNTLYAEFQSGTQTSQSIEFDEVDFLEYYDIDKDPWQMNNLAAHRDRGSFSDEHKRLHQWFRCAGNTCF